ncbi:MAG: hypothetical protein HY821_03865 [Acidobacteria bacterium]|nr:hypothetical protein [Acidobacteriota bacterium]
MVHLSQLTALAALLAAPVLAAGPLEFGLQQYRQALEARGLKPEAYPVLPEYSMVLPHDGFSIMGNLIRGGSQRGLMYGLLEAADQIRRQGHLSPVKVEPATSLRGIRWFLHNADLEQSWYHDRDYWHSFFQMLARNRFNRFNLVFAHQTAYLAPPYPFLVNVPDFPQVRARGLSEHDRERNLSTLRFISQTATEYGIDFTLGVWEHDVQKGMTPSVDGLTAENLGPYSYAALKMVLAACPAIRSVQMRTNSESGIPAGRQVEFYRDYVFKALKDSGRLVQLDLRGWLMQKGLMEAALQSGVPLRLSSKYWAEDLGRPYPPAETWPNYSFLNFLEKPGVSERNRKWSFYWELWGLGSHRLLLWGDPDYVRRTVPTFAMSGSEGFEIDPPLAQKGFGNRPGTWGVFDPSQQQRVFWKYEFQRYWLFYLLWGRLSYNPAEPDRLWADEFKARFGTAAADVEQAVRSASKVLNEIVAVHLADPNMYIWPEINPGGLIDSYVDVRPSDFRMIAGFQENALNRLHGVASAKQRPSETSERFHAWALETEQALERAHKLLGDQHREWLGTRPDLEVLALLARFHGRRQMAADGLAWFQATGDFDALLPARREVLGALRLWQQLVKLTSGLYPENMAFGPEDVGHWKDKLPYLEHDLKTIDARIALFEKHRGFTQAFDFGAPAAAPRPGSYRLNASAVANTVEPGFTAISPESSFSEKSGAGWVSHEPRQVTALPLTPYAEVRAVSASPSHLPPNVLLGDSISGSGPQLFRVLAPDGPYRAVLLKPDGSDLTLQLEARSGTLDVPLPEGTWQFSGLLLSGGPPPAPVQRWPRALAKPAFTHHPPARTMAARPLVLELQVWPQTQVKTIRLHYRPLNQLAGWKIIDAAPHSARFTIPAAEVDARWDLQYYFEVLNTEGTGWFLPDPREATPYHVVSVDVDVTPPPAEPPQ